MASGGSYVIDQNGQPVLKQRSGHILPEPPAEPVKQQQKVKTNEDEKKGTAGRG